MSNTIIHLLKFGVTACLLPGVPKDWPDNHKWVSDDQKELVNCPACLQGMQFGDPTFEILEGGKAIKCRRCGLTSYSLKDVEHRWCGNCKVSHDDLWPPARRAWLQSYAQPS
jgi:ribosomal protein L37E